MSIENEPIEPKSSNQKNMVELNNVEINKDSETELEKYPLKVYKRRWVVLAIVCTAISLRSYNQSCYGPINNILSNYFKMEPWQIDWLNSTHTLVYIFFPIPMLLVTTKIGFRLTVVIMTTSQTISFFLTTLSVTWRSTFPIALIGQIFMAISTTIAGSIPPSTAAIWFPKNEVATAVAIHLVAIGTGDAIGSIVPNLILKNHYSAKQVSTKFLVYIELTSDSQLGVHGLPNVYKVIFESSYLTNSYLTNFIFNKLKVYI